MTLAWRLSLLAFLAHGCASTPPAPPVFFPAKLELHFPPPPKPIDTLGFSRFPDVPVPEGKCGLPGGILVSEAVYAEGIQVYGERDRLRAENASLLKLRNIEWKEVEAAQKALLSRIAETDAALSRERSWRPWLLVAGAALASTALILGRR